MKTCFTVFSSILLWLWIGPAFAQKLDYSFFTYNKQSGLPDNTIYDIFQDSEGFLWLCCGNGLVRYDGYVFKSYGRNGSQQVPGITSSRPVHMMEDRKGFLWISTSDQGVFVYSPRNDSFKHFSHQPANPGSLSSDDIHCVFQDSKDRIWVCTLGGGLDLYDSAKESFTHFIHRESDSLSIPGNDVTSMMEDSSGRLWVAPSGKYICCFNPQTGAFKRYQTSFSKGPNMDAYYKHFLQTDLATVWIATYGSGVYKFSLKDFHFERYWHSYQPNDISNNNVEAIIPEDTSKLFIITDGGGLNILDDKTGNVVQVRYNFNTRNGLSTDALYSIFKDKSNNIWIGTYRGGLLMIKDKSREFDLISQRPDNKGLNYKSVLCMLHDKEGNFWYGTDGGGLDCYNPKTHQFSYYTYNPHDSTSISNNVVKVLFEDKQGTLWAGTFFGGLNKFDRHTKRFKRYQFKPGHNTDIGSNNIWCMFEDSRNNLWIGNFSSGLDVLDRQTDRFRHFQPDNNDSTSISHTQVSSIIEDKAGDVWIATLKGLNILNHKTLKFRRFYHRAGDKNSLSDDKINCLFYDSKQRLWVGTDDGGLDCMTQPGRFKVYDKSNGLPDNSIQSIQEDKEGYLWISTKNGLVKFNPSTEQFFNFDDFEGLISNEFNWNSSFYSNDNQMYFGSIDGVVVFKPNEVKFSNPFPKVVITDLKVFNTSVVVGKRYHGRVLLDQSTVYGGKAILTPKENAFSIEFASLEFNHPLKIKYRYRLMNFDSTWVYTGPDQCNATYTNLPGGNYIFEVTSTNSDGIWNKAITRLQITVIPPFYRTWWFKMLLLFVVFLFSYLLFRRNIEKHRKIVQEKALQREKELIEKRNEELKAEIASNTMLLLQKNESMDLIKTQLQELTVDAGTEKKVKELVSLLEQEMETDVYWEQFHYNFDQVYKNLLTKLKTNYPELTKTNLKLCAYLRMNLSSKEIASLMNVTISGTDKARNRLRKKLGLQPSDDLYAFLLKQ